MYVPQDSLDHHPALATFVDYLIYGGFAGLIGTCLFLLSPWGQRLIKKWVDKAWDDALKKK